MSRTSDLGFRSYSIYYYVEGGSEVFNGAETCIETLDAHGVLRLL